MSTSPPPPDPGAPPPSALAAAGPCRPRTSLSPPPDPVEVAAPGPPHRRPRQPYPPPRPLIFEGPGHQYFKGDYESGHESRLGLALAAAAGPRRRRPPPHPPPGPYPPTYRPPGLPLDGRWSDTHPRHGLSSAGRRPGAVPAGDPRRPENFKVREGPKRPPGESGGHGFLGGGRPPISGGPSIFDGGPLTGGGDHSWSRPPKQVPRGCSAPGPRNDHRILIGGPPDRPFSDRLAPATATARCHRSPLFTGAAHGVEA